MFEAWFDARLAEIKATADEASAEQIDHLAATGKMLIDYLILQLNGVSLSTQPVKKAGTAE